MAKLSSKLKGARQRLNLSQDKLAELTDLSSRSIKAYEGDEKYPRKGTIIRLAEVLNVSVKYLVDENCDDPNAEIQNNQYYITSRQRLTTNEADEFEASLGGYSGMLAGGDGSKVSSDQLFDALISAFEVGKDLSDDNPTPDDDEEEVEE